MIHLCCLPPMKSLGIFLVILLATITLFAVIGASGGSSGVGVGVLIAFLLIFYFLPAFIGYSRRHPSCHGILALNLLLGWTLLGWVVAIVWSLKSYKANVQVVFANPEQYRSTQHPSDSVNRNQYD